jgi:hypothetical protein
MEKECVEKNLVRHEKKTKDQKIKGQVIFSIFAIACLSCGALMISLYFENQQSDNKPDDCIVNYIGNVWCYVVVATLDAFIRLFVSIELFMSIRNYSKGINIQKGKSSENKKIFKGMNLKDILPVFFGGIVSMLSTCLVLS